MPLLSKSSRFSFLFKVTAALLLITFAEVLFPFDVVPGATIGLFGAGWTIAVAATRRGGWRSIGALAALAIALVYAFALFDDPSLLAFVLLWTAITLAALLPRRRFGNALGWILPLIVHACIGPFRPLMDAWHLSRVKRRPGRLHLGSAAATLALPVIGGLLFVGLFAFANPVISQAFERASVPGPLRIIFWGLVLLAVWPALRPWAGTTRNLPGGSADAAPLPTIPLASVLIALATFNAIFAVQNGLDIAFLWSGAPLPAGVTLAEYAHRGAYALIATALIAGALALWMLRPGSATAAHPWARALLVLWVAQNLLLVASSMLRTIDYVEVYSLTELRIAALAWMVLVGIGLALICWRILAGKSGAWLVNFNLAAATTLLTAACFVDLGAVAAQWNVRHAREVGGAGAAIDLCYLDQLGESALLPLIELEPRIEDAEIRDRVTALRHKRMIELVVQQRDWHSWTWRGARRLAVAQAMLGPKPVLPKPADFRYCGGMIPAPDPVLVPAAPVTPTPAKAPTKAPIKAPRPLPELTRDGGR